MMFGIGIVLMLLGISLAGLTAIGIVTAGVSALPLAVWVTMLIMAVVASFAGLFLSIKN
jgi:hypothetical protein